MSDFLARKAIGCSCVCVKQVPCVGMCESSMVQVFGRTIVFDQNPD